MFTSVNTGMRRKKGAGGTDEPGHAGHHGSKRWGEDGFYSGCNRQPLKDFGFYFLHKTKGEVTPRSDEGKRR